MSQPKIKFTITIPTKNRLEELKITLKKVEHLLAREDITCLLCDDGSTDGTSQYVANVYPKINILRNANSRGIHFTRNRLLNTADTEYVLSIDDDAHFISEDVLGTVEAYFDNNPKAALLSFRAYWDKEAPKSTHTNQKPKRVQNFGAVGFAIRIDAWKKIPNFLEWFMFYGEEDYAAFQLFKKGLEIHYLPEVLVHHRVNLKQRRQHNDYRLRLRRSIRAGWYMYILFYPWSMQPKLFLYTMYMQIKLKVLKGDLKAFAALLQAFTDVVYNFPRLLRNSNRFSKKEIQDFKSISLPEYYWQPEHINKVELKQ